MLSSELQDTNIFVKLNFGQQQTNSVGIMKGIVLAGGSGTHW